jgi:predicted nucleic acid-binding protein
MILLDTSVIVAYYNKSDKHHERARRIIEEIANNKYGDIFINEQIFSECATIFMIKLGDIKKACFLLDSILEATYLIHSNDEMFNKTFEIFKKQRSSRLSFADCSLIASAKENGISSIASFDEDFKKIEGLEVIN